MAEFRQQGPEVQPVRRDLSGARRFEGTAGLAGAVLGFLPGYTEQLSQSADREFDNKIALALTDPKVTGINRDPETEEIEISAAKLKRSDGQRSLHNQSRVRATVEARRLAEKYPHRAAEVFQKFGLMTGQPILAAARDIEEEARRPILEQQAQVDQWSLAEGISLSVPRAERTEQFMNASARMQEAAQARREVEILQNQGILTNHRARRTLQKESGALYEEMSALVTQITSDIDPANISAADATERVAEYRGLIDSRIDEVIESYDGHITRQEAEQILAPSIRLFQTAVAWVNGETSLAHLESANKFLREAHDNQWLNTPGFQDLERRASLIRDLPANWGTPLVQAREGNAFFKEYKAVLEANRRVRNGNSNPIADGQEEGMSDRELGRLTESAMKYLASVSQNEDANPIEVATAAEMVLTAYTNQFSEDPSSVPTSVYDSVLFALGDSQVGPWLNDVGAFGENAQAFRNYRRMTQRYMRDITEDVASEVQRLSTDPTVSSVASAAFSLPFGGISTVGRSIREMTRGIIEFDIKNDGRVVATPVNSGDRRMSDAADSFNEKYSDRFGMVSRSQAHLFGLTSSDDYKQAANRFLDGAGLDTPDPDTLNSASMDRAIENLRAQGFSEEQIQMAVEEYRNQQ